MSDENMKNDEAGSTGQPDAALPAHGGQSDSGNAGPPKPAQPSRQDTAAARKKERLAAALRDNLKRRKAQMRGRRAMGEDDGESGDS